MDLVRQNISSISFWGSWKSTWTEEGPQHHRLEAYPFFETVMQITASCSIIDLCYLPYAKF